MWEKLFGIEDKDPVPTRLPPEYWEEQVRELLANGRKIDAIKLYLEMTGVGVKEAKDAVERVERGESAQVVAPPEDWQAQVRHLLHSRRKIDAIKLYREMAGVGLKEAKDAVEAME